MNLIVFLLVFYVRNDVSLFLSLILSYYPENSSHTNTHYDRFIQRNFQKNGHSFVLLQGWRGTKTKKKKKRKTESSSSTSTKSSHRPKRKERGRWDFFSSSSSSVLKTKNETNVSAPVTKKAKISKTNEVVDLTEQQQQKTETVDLTKKEVKKVTTTPKKKTTPNKKRPTPKTDSTTKKKKPKFNPYNRGNVVPPNAGQVEIPKDCDPRALCELTFVLTGVLNSLTREQAKTLILDHGGRVTTGVSGRTSYLVSGAELEDGRKASEGSKSKKAIGLKIPIIDEAKLLHMLRTLVFEYFHFL